MDSPKVIKVHRRLVSAFLTAWGCLLAGGSWAETFEAGHGYEIAPGWWGWYGGSAGIATELSRAADQAIGNPERQKYTFEYDACSWEFFEKYHPELITRLRKAVALRAWDVVGGTYSGHLPYQVSLESNIRQFVAGTRTIREVLGQQVETYDYQEFMIFPQLPMFLSNVGIRQSVCENHYQICGKLRPGFAGTSWWTAADGSRVKAISEHPDVQVGWPDVLHLVPAPRTLSQKIRALPFGAAGWTREGKFGGSLHLDGRTWLKAANLGLLERATVSMWLKTEGLDRPQNAVLHTRGWERSAVHVLLLRDGRLQLCVNGNDPTDSAPVNCVPPISDQWLLLAIVYDAPGKTASVWTNGVLAASLAYKTALPLDLQSEFILGGWDGANRNLLGKLDDVRIFGEALAPEQVRRLYQGMAPEAPPLAWWKLDETSGSLAGDASGNLHTARLNDVFKPTESDFDFNAADYTDSYGNMASIQNRLAENEVLRAERAATAASLLGEEDRSDQLYAAWKAILGAQNHDISYCGSECYGAEIGSSDFEGARYLRETGRKLAADVLGRSLDAMSQRADTRSVRPGRALVVFNPMAYPISGVVDQRVSFAPGAARGLKLWQQQRELPFQISGLERHQDGSFATVRLVFKAEQMPGIGFRVYHLEPLAAVPPGNTLSGLVVNHEAGIVENQFVRLQLGRHGGLQALYSKQQGNKLLLGAEPGAQALPALRFLDSVGGFERYQPKGWELVESGPVKAVVRLKYVSKLARANLELTLYDNVERVDFCTELSAKESGGDLLEMPPGEEQERLWLQFVPAFDGEAKCDTVADFQRSRRSYYFANSWIHWAGADRGFTLLHKGIHAWNLDAATRIPKPSQPWDVGAERNNSLPYGIPAGGIKNPALSAQLGQTTTRWVPGMLRLNTGFGHQGVIRQEFALLPNAMTNEARISRAAEPFHFAMPSVEATQHPGEAWESSLLSVQNDNILVTAFYTDLAAGKNPVLRLWNPGAQASEAQVALGFKARQFQEIRCDGTETSAARPWSGRIQVPAGGLKTVRFAGLATLPQSPPRQGIVSTSVPCSRVGEASVFDAPLESYRLFTQTAKYRDAQDRVFMLTDPYEEVELRFTEEAREGDYRVWTAQPGIPEAFRSRPVRLVLAWETRRIYGIGTCRLTGDNTQRADEPVLIRANGTNVPGHDFDLTGVLRYGTSNRLQVRVLAPVVPESVASRPSVAAFGIMQNSHPFLGLISGRLRVGRKVADGEWPQVADCCVVNPGFESGTLAGWTAKGTVHLAGSESGASPDPNVLLENNSALEQRIPIKPGNYILLVKARANGALGKIGVRVAGKEYGTRVTGGGAWQQWAVRFSVPPEAPEATLYASRGDQPGTLHCDDFTIVANKVAKQFPTQAE